MNFSNSLCEPYILPGSGARAEHGVLMIHGFTGSPAQLWPLAKGINDCGYTVSGLLLPGHCTSLEDMARVTWREYVTSVRAGFDRISQMCGHVIVVGFSMGGLLGMLLSARHPVEGCVTLSAAVRQRNRLAPLSPVLKYIMPKVIKWPENPDRRGEDFLHEYDFGYSGMPLRRVADLMRLSSMAREEMSRIKCPLLVIQSDKDETVHPSSADIIMARAGSKDKRQIRLKLSGHIITLGPEREEVKRAVCQWLQGVTG